MHQKYKTVLNNCYLECDEAYYKCVYFRHKVLEIHHTSEDKLDKLIKLGHQFEVNDHSATVILCSTP